MDKIINYFSTYTITDLFAAIVVIIVAVRGIEKVGKKIYEYFNALYYKKRGIEKKDNTLEEHSQKIEALGERIDKLVTAISGQYEILNKKIDEQNIRLEIIDREGKVRDCSVLRDRILGGLRYFSQNIDEQGRVHISLTDHENMSSMFTEYFKAGGNGTVKHLKETQFDKFIIDND